jgi:uncharacterized membrane protein
MLRVILRNIVAAIYLVAGVLHIGKPAPFLSITPDWVPFPALVVTLTGIAEILGAVGLAQGWSRRLRSHAAIGLALYAVCVFPANINHFIQDQAKPDGGLELIYHVPRMFAQPLIIWATLWTGKLIDWPLPGKGR